MNPYLDENNKPTETLLYTLDYYGISLDDFKQMTDVQVRDMVKTSSDVLNDGRTRKSGDIKPYKRAFDYMGQTGWANPYKGNEGSFSRYFSLDAWWAERVKQLPESARKTFPFLVVPKASKREKNEGCEDLKAKPAYKGDGSGNSLECFGSDKPRQNNPKGLIPQDRKNTHPTCKPLKLMSYLITLGSREGDIVCDPFLGSGTTAVAAISLNRRYIGFEISPEYVKIANARIARTIQQTKLELD